MEHGSHSSSNLPPCLVQTKNTVWSKINQAPHPDVDFKSLEEQFAVEDKGPKPLKGLSSCKKPIAKMLLPVQRSNNVGIMLANLKMTPAQVKDAILQLLTGGSSPLTDEQLEAVSKSLPTDVSTRL